MAIDVFLPQVVRQAITIDKSGSNVSGTLIPQKDPSGEENRGVKGQPSPTESFGALFVEASGAQKPNTAKPTPPTLATPPFADYLAPEKIPKNTDAEAENHQPLSPLIMQQMPPMISEFLNDIAKKHGVAAPSQQQLQTALRMTSDYRPPKPVIIDTDIVKPIVEKPRIIVSDVTQPPTPQKPVSQQEAPQQKSQQKEENYRAGFDDLSENIQKSALDYGRMLEALSRYSVHIQQQH